MSLQWSPDVRRLWLPVVVTFLQILWVGENGVSASPTNLADPHLAQEVRSRLSTSMVDAWAVENHMAGRQPLTCGSVRGDWAAAYRSSTMRPRAISAHKYFHRFSRIQQISRTRPTQLRRQKSFRRNLAMENQTGSTQDREALIAFKKILIQGFYVGRALLTWDSIANPNVCSGWEGIHCNGAGRVIVLNVSRMFLGGEIGFALGNLTSLETLDLSGNDLIGQIPRSVANLSSLRELNLGYNFLAGPFPEAILNMTNLKTLDLSGYELSDGIPSALRALTQLQILDLKYTGLSGTFPDNVFGLPNLRSLYLSWNSFTGNVTLSGIRNLAKLEVLHLSHVADYQSSIPWTFPEEILSLLGLRSLDLSGNSFEGVLPEAMLKLVNLRSLDLSDNDFTGILPEAVFNFSNLSHLDLFGNSFTISIPSKWQVWKNLEYLDLSDNSLNGSFPEALLSPPNLRHLRLGQTFLTGAGPSGSQVWKQLEHLDLSRNALNGTFPQAVLSATNLKFLDLSYNSFTGGVPLALQNLSQLEELLLHNNLFNGEFPKAILRLTNLESLQLEYNNFSGSIPSELRFLTGISILDLSNNRFNAVSETLSSLTHLWMINLKNNSFTGDVSLALPGLENLDGLESLNLGMNLFNGHFPETILRLTNLTELRLGDNNFSGSIPSGLRLLTRMRSLDLSNNDFNGTFPEALSTLTDLLGVYLWNNRFTGTLPMALYNMTGLTQLDLSENCLTGRLDSKIGDLSQLSFLNLSSNSFNGEIPTELDNCTLMEIFDLSHNNLTGRISMDFDAWHLEIGHPPFRLLNLAGNKFHGDVPSSLANCTYLRILDLSDNSLTGMYGLFNLSLLRVLQLSSNQFSGEIPSWIWRLPQLQILDLSRNSFEGHIREDLIVWDGMNVIPNDTTSVDSSGTLRYAIEITFKDKSVTFYYLLETMASVDLSANQLSGSIPNRVLNLKSLQGLTLSQNKFTSFPNESKATTLQSLDISLNNISGTIPSFLGNLDSLGVLKLAGNNFSGQIPRNGHLSTFNDNRSFLPGNPNLCGLPLSKNCTAPALPGYTVPFRSSGADNEWVSFLALGIGAALGFVWVGAVLILYRPARLALFSLVKLPPKRHRDNYDRKYGLFREQDNRIDRG